jgi:predicted dehydrogenase
MKIRTAIIGCGDVVQSYGNNSESMLNHLAALEQNKNYEIIGISDTDESKLKSARERYKIKNSYNSYKDLILENEIDLVIVAVPTSLHYELIKFLIDHEISDIFCEKPLTNSLKEIKNINESLANQNIYVNYFRRWNEELEREAGKVQEGTYGKFIKGNCYYTKDLYTNGSHILHILNWFLGNPDSVKTRYLNQCNNEIFADFTLNFNDSPININCLEDVDYVLIELDLIFTKGRIKIMQRGQKLVIGQVIRDENYDFNKIAEHEINTKWNECFSNAYKNIEECIIGKKVNKCDINSALQVHKILDDIKNEK